LGPAGEAGLDAMPLAVEKGLLGHLLHELRPLGARAHEAHVPGEDVPELRKFIETRAPHEAAQRRHPRIASRLRPYRSRVPLGVDAHGPELADREEPTVQADA